MRKAADGSANPASMLEAASVVAYLEISPDGLVRGGNRCLLDLLGVSTERELVGRPFTELVVARRSWSDWQASALSGRERGVSLTFLGPEGRSVVLKGDLIRPPSARDDSLVGLFVDIGEERRLGEALQRAARMEALGSLTSGIAHDFNNLLTVLVGNLYLVAEDLRGDEKIFQKLKAARDAANRGADLIKQLLAFARRERLEAEDVDPAKVVAGLVPLLTRALGSKITLDTRCVPSAGRVRCSGAQLESAIVNLAVNARDAISGSGRITIVTEPVEVGSAEGKRSGVPPGSYLLIKVADDGSGIPPDVLDRVFEPFFTTKRDKGGTGLGLGMVRWFAQQAGGAVSIDSTPGRGTVVSVLLPRSADHAAETMSRTAPLSTLPGGEERIAVLSRDDSVRSTIEQILRVLGYDVHSASDAGEMLRHLQSRSAEMLVLDGAAQDADARRRFMRAAAQARPGIRIIVAVDAADAARAKRAAGEPWLLAKPFSIPDIARTVRRAFDAQAAPR